jgi:hypothetical protein
VGHNGIGREKMQYNLERIPENGISELSMQYLITFNRSE